MALIVKDSGINGRGVYTDAPIRKGDLVLAWNPKLLSDAELADLPQEEHRYLEMIDGKPHLMQAPERYVNHSCDANTKPDGTKDVAVRDIEAGEEITSDYRLSNSDQDFECRCGSKKCAGRIITYKHT